MVAVSREDPGQNDHRIISGLGPEVVASKCKYNFGVTASRSNVV